MKAQLPPLIDRDVFFADPQLAGVQLSPDGKYLSFLRAYEGALNIWLQPINDGQLQTAFPLTKSPRPISSYFWSHDSRYVIYAQDRDGDENDHLYRLSVAEAAPDKMPTPLDLTPRQGVKALLYSLPQDRPDIALIGLNDRDPSLHDLYELELATGKLTLKYQNADGVLGWAMDAVGKVRFATKLGPEGETQIYEVRPGKKWAFTLRYQTAWDESAGIAHIPRKGRSVYLITNKGADKTRLLLWDPAKGTEKPIHQDPTDRVDISAATFHPKTDELLLVAYAEDQPRRYFFSPKWEARYKTWANKLPGYEVGLSDYSEDERYFVLMAWHDREPGHYYLWDEKTQQLTDLGRNNPHLPTAHLAERKPVRLPSREGVELPAYLTLPKGLPPKNLPAVLLVHGGPWWRDQYGYDAFAQFLANRGYAVLQVNFRASTGYGKAFLNAGNREWGTGRMQHDLTDAVQAMIQQGVFDPQRIAIMGGSYGGYATLAGVTFTPNLYKCGVSIVGPSSIMTLIRSVPPYWRPALKIFHTRVGNPDDPADLERLKAQSPLYHVERIRVPLLIIQGANDPRVKQQESDQIVYALYQKALPVQYLLAPDEGHGFRQYINRMAMMVAIENFLAQHLGGRVQPEVRDPIANRLRALTIEPATVKPPSQEAASLSTPRLKPTLEKPLTSRWLFSIQMGMKSVTAKVQHRWEKLPEGWRFQEEVESEVSRLRTSDTTLLSADGSLIRYHRTQTGIALSLQVQPERRLTGELQAMGQKLPIEKAIPPDVVPYPLGSALIYYLGSLPLAQGYKTQVPLFSIQKQDFAPVSIEVLGEETITVASRSLSTWRVKLVSEGTIQEVWISQADKQPYRLSTQVMGASMMGDRID
jgi:dipeptidyl aminopeptidase/acylaminoacyl peptidase